MCISWKTCSQIYWRRLKVHSKWVRVNAHIFWFVHAYFMKDVKSGKQKKNTISDFTFAYFYINIRLLLPSGLAFTVSAAGRNPKLPDLQYKKKKWNKSCFQSEERKSERLDAGRRTAIISSMPHQKNGNISTGPPAFLQYLTYYHNIVSEVWSACMPVWRLIANRQDSKAADPKLRGFTGNRLWHCFEGQLLLPSNPNRCPPPPLPSGVPGPAETPITGSWRGLLFSPLPLTLTAPLKSSLKLCLRVSSHHRHAQPRQSTAY